MQHIIYIHIYVSVNVCPAFVGIVAMYIDQCQIFLTNECVLPHMSV